MTQLSLGNKKRTFTSYREAADEAGIEYMVFYMRIRNGWTVAKALNTPVRKKKATK